jgi:hypothetical protein
MGLKCATPACRARGSFQRFVGNCGGQDFFVGLVDFNRGFVHGIASLLRITVSRGYGDRSRESKGADLSPRPFFLLFLRQVMQHGLLLEIYLLPRFD